MDNREGLVVDVRLTPAAGTGERDAALAMLVAASGSRRITVGADRGYDTRGFVAGCRKSRVTPHVAQKRRLDIDRPPPDTRGIYGASGPGNGSRRSSAG